MIYHGSPQIHMFQEGRMLRTAIEQDRLTVALETGIHPDEMVPMVAPLGETDYEVTWLVFGTVPHLPLILPA